jgi:phi13 family phage major tail protein
MKGLSRSKKLKSSKFGLRNVHIAEYDPVSDQWTEPVPVETIKSMSIAVNITHGEEYADDQLFEVFDAFNNFEVELSFTDLTPEEQAFLYGWESVGAIRLSGSNDNPPWIALMGERLKGDGTYRYFKYFKGKARIGGYDAQTKADSVNTQPDSLSIVFAPLANDFPIPAYRGKAKAILDETDPEYQGEAELWYEDVVPGRTYEDG